MSSILLLFLEVVVMLVDGSFQIVILGGMIAVKGGDLIIIHLGFVMEGLDLQCPQGLNMEEDAAILQLIKFAQSRLIATNVFQLL